MAVSAWPEAPKPRLRGRGRLLPTLSSSASRINSAIDVPRSAAIWRKRASRCSGVTIVVRRMPSLCHERHNERGGAVQRWPGMGASKTRRSTCSPPLSATSQRLDGGLFDSPPHLGHAAEKALAHARVG